VKDPLDMQLCLSNHPWRRDVHCIFESFADSMPRYTAKRGTIEDTPMQRGACKRPRGNLHPLQGDPRWKLRKFMDA